MSGGEWLENLILEAHGQEPNPISHTTSEPDMPTMTFNDYQKRSREHAFYPDMNKNLTYPVIGLAGETGEIAEKVKKILRDKGGRFNAEDIEGLKKEIGDVLWYLAALATELGLSFEEVAYENLQKIEERSARGTLKGSGDNR